jgi:hypothetical protein
MAEPNFKSLGSNAAKDIWFGFMMGGLSLVGFVILFLHLISLYPALDPASNPTEGSRSILSTRLALAAFAASFIGALLSAARHFTLKASKAWVRVLGSTFALALWALLYSPASFLLLNFTVLDFVKYDHSFRDLATGSMLDLERSYLLLLRWGIAIQVLIFPVCLLSSLKYLAKSQ